jgi:hypothetical protein
MTMKSRHLATIAGVIALQLPGAIGFQAHAQAPSGRSGVPASSAAARDEREDIDNRLALAHQSGKAIVIMAALNFRHKYPNDIVEDMHLADQGSDIDGAAMIDRKALVEWRSDQSQGARLVVSEGRPPPGSDASGSIHRFSVGAVTYHIFITEPGRYRLSAVRHPMPRTTLPDRATAAGRAAADGRLGTISLEVVAFNEMRVEQQWQPEQWRDVEPYQECAATYGGGCVEYRWVFGERELVQPAGYYDTLVNVPVPGLNIAIDLKEHFASFEVAPRQTIIVDGFYPDPPSADFDLPDCADQQPKRWVCRMSALALVQAAASESDVRAFDFATSGFPRLAALIADARYRPLDLSAKPIGKLKEATVYRLAD